PARLASATKKLAALDPALAAMVARDGLPPMWVRPPGYATLIRIILEQQVTLASGAAAYRRLSEGVGRVTPGMVYQRSEAQLRRLGLTRQKARYCRELARALIEGDLDLTSLSAMNAEAVRKAMMKVTGIGVWTSDIYLLTALRHPDIWPRGDLALYQVMRQAFNRDDPPSKLDLLASRWRPWRSVAARILWHHYLKTRGS
ncbi:MAG: DNA-3-methyladenine glycosylase 2 family protein, partial [Planctomycetota bacterium]|nr:DNA-3-methyladenine glycosylase 2 family protein [Planctomycetota bacterium]